MPALDPESVYFIPTPSLSVNRTSRVVTARAGVTVYAKIGARWRSMLLLPDEGESVGALYARLGQWAAEEPATFASELFEGRDRARSGD